MENKASVNETSVDEESVVNTGSSEPKRKIEWNTILAAISVFSIVLGGIAALIRYFGEALYLSFWGISIDFAHTSNKSFLSEILLIVGLSLILLLLSYGIKKLFDQSQDAEHRVLKHAILFVCICALTIFIFCFLFAFLSWVQSDDTKFTFHMDSSFWVLAVLFGILFTGIAHYIGWKLYTVMRPYKNMKELFNKKGRRILAALAITVIFVGGSYVLTYRFQTCKDTTTFDIIDNQYVVLYKDTDTFIVKECCIHENNMIYIDMDTYRLIDAKNVEVQTIRLNPIGGGQAFRRLSSEEYAEHLASDQATPDTPS